MAQEAQTAEETEQDALAEVEREAQILAESAEINPYAVDLALPTEYLTHIMAQHRLQAAREAIVARHLEAANKAVNPAKAEEHGKAFRGVATFVAILDRYYPGAKPIATEIAEEAARELDRQRQERQAARKKAE